MKIKRLLFWVSLIFALDQTTKWLILISLPPEGRFPVIPHFFDIVHVKNPGAAFGLLSGLPESYRLPLLITVSLIAVVLIGYYYLSLPAEEKKVQIPLAMILGGAAGNLFDRFVREEVVDFLSFHWYDDWFWWRLWGFYGRIKLEWPAFNVADSAITLAVCWLVFLMIKERKFL